MPAPRTHAIALLVVLVLALAARGAASALPGRLIERDGIRYARLGRAIAEGDGRAALRDDYPPGYPLAVALSGLASGARDDLDWARAAVLASVLAGALTILPVAAIATRAAGSRAGVLAGLVVAVHARHVSYSADAVSEPLFGLLVLSALACASRALSPGEAYEAPVETRGSSREFLASALAGGLSGAAFLVRPEGVAALACALVAVAWRRERRAGRIAAFCAPLLAVALPYVAYVSARAGSIEISQKKHGLDLLRAALATPLSTLEIAAKDLGRAWDVGPVAMALGAVGCIVARGKARRAMALLLGAGACFLALYATVRVDPRFGLILSLLAAPMAGVGLDAMVERTRRPAIATAAAIALLLGISGPLAVHALRADKAHYLDCARTIAAEARQLSLSGPTVAAYDPRIAFYAGAVALPEGAPGADFRVIDETAAGPAPTDAPRLLARFPPPAEGQGRTLLLYARGPRR